jgi:hypothetical protein
MAFSADGNQLVTGLETGTALVWDVSAAWEKLVGPSDDTSSQKGAKP